ncbi:MAG TPA: methylmalonyl Co-A mutase-associated GTPase MeaB [Terriglobales bacterium]|nr:methylmalonyl Co-A mutase-associated GTPase MeaB [Terriglobales bacterium]
MNPGPPPVVPEVVARLRSDRRALARALSLIAGDAGTAAEAGALLQAVAPYTGGARTVGITGPPGSGKSTLVAALTGLWRQAGQRVGIVAVDPSSPFSGGAILGDRIRMLDLHPDPGVFMRSLATRGALGGLAAAAYGAVRIFDAAGMHNILIETVGVGQDEVDIAQLADITVVVLVPGMGDAVQALKAGLLEIADVFVINKAESGADRLQQDLRAALMLAAADPDAWRPPIVQTVATAGTGLLALAAALDQRWGWVADHGGWAAQRARQWERRLPQLARERLAARLLPAVLTPARLHALAAAIAAGADAHAALDDVIDEMIVGAAGAQTLGGRGPARGGEPPALLDRSGDGA